MARGNSALTTTDYERVVEGRINDLVKFMGNAEFHFGSPLDDDRGIGERMLDDLSCLVLRDVGSLRHATEYAAKKDRKNLLKSAVAPFVGATVGYLAKLVLEDIGSIDLSQTSEVGTHVPIIFGAYTGALWGIANAVRSRYWHRVSRAIEEKHKTNFSSD